MVDQPGAGNSNTYKIRAYTSRQRHTAKPYARPSGRKKSVLETVRDFLAPSWLVGWFQKKDIDTFDEDTDAKLENEYNDFLDGNKQSLNQESRSQTDEEQESCTTVRKPIDKIKIGNGQLPSAKGTFSSYSYYTPTLQRPKLTSDFPATSTETASDAFELREVRREFGREDRNESLSLDREVTPCSADSSGQEHDTSGNRLPDKEDTRLDYSAFQDSILHQLNKPRRESNIKKLSTSRLVSSRLGVKSNSSPFYPGKTSYGGASSSAPAYKRMRMSGGHVTAPPQTYQPMKMQVKPKPVSGVSNTGVTSQTAKRILESLEKMSSPLIDAKKVPPPSSSSPSDSPLSFVPTKRKVPVSTVNKTVGSARSLKAQFSGPPVVALSTPQRASISRIRPRELEVSKVVSIAESASTSAIPVVSTSLRNTSTITRPITTFTFTPLPMSLSPVTSSSSPKGGGKMKTARNTGHYTLKERKEEEEEVINPLPEVTSAVPLTLASNKGLPSFSFGISAHSTPMPINTTKIQTSLFPKPEDKAKNNFKFSAPAAKAPSVEATKKNNLDTNSRVKFSFSQPVQVSGSGIKDSDAFANEKKCEVKKPVNLGANELLKKIGPSLNSWECETCLINNKASESKCIACSAPKPRAKPAASKSSQIPAANLMKKFAPPVGSWDCEACLINNKTTDEKCVACQAAKPVTKKPTSSDNKTTNDLLEKFAPPTGSWTCDTCLISNNATDKKCVACQALKTGELASEPKLPTVSLSKGSSVSGLNSQDANNNDDLAKKFAPAAGSWTCDSCMIDNKSGSEVCAACSTPKPGSKPTTGSAMFHTQNGPGGGNIKFGAGNSNSLDANKTKPGFTFGGSDSSSKDAPVPDFTFGGQPSTVEKSESSKNLTFTFGAGASDSVSSSKRKSIEAGDNINNASTTTPANFTFGGAISAVKKDESGPKAIAQATAEGFLNVPAKTNIEKTTSAQGSPAKPSSIAEAASLGFLKVPGVGDKKEVTAPPPNVNLFGPSSTSITSQGTAAIPTQFKLPEKTGEASSAPSFSFNAKTTVKSECATKEKPTESSSSAIPGFGISSPPATGFSFGAPASSATFPTSSSLSQFSFSAAPGTALGQSGLGAAKLGSPQVANSGVVTSSAPAASLGGVFGSASTGNTNQSITTSTVTPFAFKLATTSSSVVSPFMTVSAAPVSSTMSIPSFSFNPGATANTTTESTKAPAFAPFPSSKTSNTDTKPAFSFTPGTGTSAGVAAPRFQFGASGKSSDQAKTSPQPFQFNAGTGDTGKIGSQPLHFNVTVGSGDAAKPTSQPFQFAAAVSNSDTTKAVAQTFQFGTSGGVGDTPKPSFNFGGAQSTGSQPFVFGGASSTVAPTAATAGASDEVMDADGNSNQASATPFMFAAKPGNSVFSAAANLPSGNVFGSSLTASAPGTTPAFGAGTALNSTSLSTPAFGAGAASSSSPAFGSTATTSSNSGFAFGNAQTAPGGFNFGGSQPNTAGASSNTFVFGAGGNVAPAFGGQPSAAAATGGFNFSSSTLNAAAAGGFNFNGGSSQGASPAFTPGTSGDSSGVATNRKFKRAVRRAKR